MVCCPAYDYECPYYEDGWCNLEDAKTQCDEFYGLEEEEEV